MSESLLRTETLNRLRNVRGHIAGIEKMVDEQQDCGNILIQLSAVRSSIEKIGLTLLENSAMDFVRSSNSSTPDDQKNLEQVIRQMLTFLKR
ncbi:MAG TPA: transcriptional regulator [Sporomusaceae bacterium]|jgi:DNA-binding FrmR family transcriptional regulator|uniref:metal-sensitive transcriptional regulator n=1 Tax=Anaerospora sp. TaxID=1960278 RepID=UPI000EDBD465|nr:metal-sensitive transcriptional regulator [Anaerospora sp.]HAK73795.1 transcriptional regulator [Sporomusaceae bacterium]